MVGRATLGAALMLQIPSGISIVGVGEETVATLLGTWTTIVIGMASAYFAGLAKASLESARSATYSPPAWFDGKARWEDVTETVDFALKKNYYTLGVTVSRWPYRVLFIMTWLAIFSMNGLRALRMDRGITGWFPPECQMFRDADWFDKHFDYMNYDRCWAIFVAKDKSDNVVTKQALVEMLELMTQIENFDVTTSTNEVVLQEKEDYDAAGMEYCKNWQECCHKLYDGATCEAHSPLDFWKNNFHELDRVNEEDLMALVSRTNVIYDELGRNIDPTKFFSGIDYTSHSSKSHSKNMTSVDAMMMSMHMIADLDYTLPWQLGVVEIFKQLPTDGPYSVHYMCDASFDVEFADAVQGDMALFALAFVTMIVFAAINMGPAHPLRGKIFVAFSGVGCIFLALLAGLGFASMSTYEHMFSSVHVMLPLIIVAIGIDDMFVMTGAFIEAKEAHDDIAAKADDGIGCVGPELEVSPEGFRGETRIERITGRMFSEIGASVTMTTATDFAAFWMGTNSTLPNIQSFSYFAAICVASDFLWQSTFFTALLALDARREEAGRADCFCCCQTPVDSPDGKYASSLPAEVAYPQGEAPTTSSPPVSPRESRHNAARATVLHIMTNRGKTQVAPNKVLAVADDKQGTGSGAPPPETGVRMLGMQCPSPTVLLLKLLLSPVGRICVLLGTALLFGIGCLGCTQVSYGFVLRDLVKRTSYLQNAYRSLETYFNTQENVVVLMTKGHSAGLNYTTAESQLALLELTKTWDEYNVENGGTKLYSWYDTFVEFVEETDQDNLLPEGIVRPASFQGLLEKFLEAPVLGDVHQKLISFDRPYADCVLDDQWGCQIESTIMFATVANMKDSTFSANYVMNAYDLVAKFKKACPAIIFVPDVMLKKELNDAVEGEIGSTVVGALIAVALCSLMFLTSARTAAIVTISIMMIDVELVGFMSFFGINLSPVSLVCIIMSIGLSFDYVAHIAYAFMHAHVENVTPGSFVHPQTQREERVALAIMEVGTVIAQSAASTALGLSFLCLAGSASYTIMYGVFTTALVLAVLHGYFIIPVMLIYMGPPELTGANERREAVAKLTGEKTEKTIMVATTCAGDAEDGEKKEGEKETCKQPGGVQKIEEDAPMSTLAKAGIYSFRVISTVFLVLMFAVSGRSAPPTPDVKRTEVAYEVLNATIPRVTTYDLMIDHYEVPTKRTTYMCQAFTLPTHSNYHGIWYDVEPGEVAVVHHAVLFGCFKPMPKGFWECATMPDDCVKMIFPWPVGAPAFEYPPEAGEQLGRNTGVVNLAIQMHYDNPLGLENVIDTTTVKVMVDHKIRDNDAGLLVLGSPGEHIEIPPGQSDYTLGFPCPPEITPNDKFANTHHLEEMFGETEVNILYTGAHMHLLGSKLWTEQYDGNGTFKRNLGTTDPYYFDYQTLIPAPRVPSSGDDAATMGWTKLAPTDKLMTYCMYDSTAETVTTMGGDATNQEMCVQFMWYFPKPMSAKKKPRLAACWADTTCAGPYDQCGDGPYSPV